MWRVGRAGRVAAALGSVAFAGLLAWIAVMMTNVIARGGSAALVGVLVLTVLTLLLGAAAVRCWLLGVRPAITLTHDQVIVRNPFSAHHLRLTDIATISATPGGIRFLRTDGTTTVAWAVQRSTLARLLGRRTRADLVVEQLRQALPAGRYFHR
ncbi:hypothetical protein HCN51_20930 [Nonomuraea sp. FMUSA5-5]|uniref:PH domain-containing protein n=1 Tax=Nonomuraea composti TaxID=2720023 RepID=A0ABX1B828_9ACTN|nr:PH domain-containing protein [Nonomuraea sp. FMUSA5-5]NJP91894.1 hypothetical protein [Nonomuraea sp. FMUSA5-5]